MLYSIYIYIYSHLAICLDVYHYIVIYMCRQQCLTHVYIICLFTLYNICTFTLYLHICVTSRDWYTFYTCHCSYVYISEEISC